MRLKKADSSISNHQDMAMIENLPFSTYQSHSLIFKSQLKQITSKFPQYY